MLSQFFQSQKLLLCMWSHHLSHMSLAHGGQYLNGHGKRDIKQCAPLLAALFCISLCLILLPCTHTVVALQKPNICHTNGELKILRTNILSCYVLAWCPTIREKSLQMFPYLLPKMKHKVVPTYSERERKKKKNKIKGKRWEKKEKERKQKEGGKKEKKRREKETKKKKKGKKGKEKKWGKKRWKKKRKKKKKQNLPLGTDFKYTEMRHRRGDDAWHCFWPKSISQGSAQQNNSHHNYRALWIVTGDDHAD